LLLSLMSALDGRICYTEAKCADIELEYKECHFEFLKGQKKIIDLEDENDRLIDSISVLHGKR